MHEILFGLPYVLGVIAFFALLVGLVIGAIKLYVWVDDNTTAFWSWFLVGSLWIILLLVFAWQIGRAYEH